MEGGISQQRDNSRGVELHGLVKEGNILKVERLLQQARSTQVVEFKLNGMTPLHVAAFQGDAEIVELLIKIGHANVHARSLEGDTPLHMAAKHGHETVVEKLLQQGAASDIMTEDKSGDSPLHGAARSGKHKIVKRMLSMAPDRQACILARNGELRTPLHYAAVSGKVEVVDLLLDTKDQNLKEVGDESGMIPFHFAAFSGDVKCLEKLVPSNINVKSKKDFTALHYAALNAKVEAVKWLMENGVSAKQKGAGADTPLHLATRSKEPESDKVAAVIVAREPESWKMKNSEGKLPLEIANECNHDHVVTAILQSLRSLTALQDDFVTPAGEPYRPTLLHYAAGHGTAEDIEWVMQKGKNMIESPDADSRTPLHWAAMKGNTSTLRCLANAGANLIRMSSKSSETPLFLALGKGHMEFAEELLKCNMERNQIAGNEGKYLTTEDWMRGVDQWMKAYYDDKVEEQVRMELRSNFEQHMSKQLTLWLLAGNGVLAYMFQEIPPLYLALHAKRLDIAKFFQRLSNGEDAVNKKGPSTGRMALHWAVLLRKRDIVEQLCKVPEFSERMRVCEEDLNGIAPIQYATELNLQDIEAELLKRDSVKDYISGLYRDREIYVDSTNAILVCAALIASVTFAGWLQPPLSYVDYAGLGSYAAIQHKGMRLFWVLNSLSFFAAIGTVQAGACGVLPLRHVHIGRAVIYIRRALMIASLLMASSVVCVLGAFGAAGFIVLPPIPKYEMYMVATVALGGLINTGLLLWFIYRVLIGPQLQRMGRHSSAFNRAASAPTNVQTVSARPDRTPSKESPPQSTDQLRRRVPSWDDGIKELHDRNP